MGNPNRRATAAVLLVVTVLVGGPAAVAQAGFATDAIATDEGASGASPSSAASAASAALAEAQQTTTAANQQTTTTATTETDATTAEETAETTMRRTPDHEVSPRPLPERPETLNASSANRYVATYEEARKHNEILRETTDVTITSIDVRCGPTSLDEQDGGFVVEVACGFSYEFGENGTPTGIADGLPYLARYFVDDNTTELLGLRSGLGVGAALPLPVPGKPDPLNETNVLQYAAAYEEVRKHNEILDEANAPNATVTETFVSCLPELVEETDGGFLVDVSCSFAYFVNQDGSVVIVESLLVPSYTAQYRINETATELVSVQQAVGPNRTTTPAETTTAGGETTTARDETTTTAEA